MQRRKEMTRLPNAELEIMKVIWNCNQVLSTAQIKENLEKKRPWNISALQTLLKRLIDRGFLNTYKEGKNRFYTACMKEDTYLAFENKLFLDKVNNNSLTKLVASLYDSSAVSAEDLDELAVYIRQKTGG